MNIKKKLIAIALVCAMAVSFSACSDKKSGTKNGVATNATLSSEEIQSLQKHDLTIEPYDESAENAQDPVENSNSDAGNNDTGSAAVQGENNNSSSNNQSGNNSSSGNNNSGNNNNNNNNDDDNTVPSLNEDDLLHPTDVVMIPGKNQDSSESDNSSDNSGNETTAGKKEIMQAWWMDLSKSKDFVFDGEFITAQFKIKDTTANGTYPVTIEWTDFSNWDAQSVKFSTTDGAVVVGSEATPNSFKNDGSAEIMATNVSGNPGDTVTVTFNMKNNPGIVACVFRFGYDSDALEYVGGGSGKDFSGTFS
ncbi:cohesin domain-containing protein [Porcipelethomonas sp.]|uniref:cohesin domain-containing protein n=1 Tax=Porcipelethomonas sp. TaxID=2981675 RepID=UPI003EF216C5